MALIHVYIIHECVCVYVCVCVCARTLMIITHTTCCARLLQINSHREASILPIILNGERQRIYRLNINIICSYL